MLKDPQTRKWLISGFGKILRYEIKTLCSDKISSVQRSNSKDSLPQFPWRVILEEAMEHCPTLFNLLFQSTMTKKARPNQLHVITVIICMLSKFHRSNMSLLQRLISILLYAEHVGTIVCAGGHCYS